MHSACGGSERIGTGQGLIVRWATADDLRQFYGDNIGPSVRARVAEMSGEIVGVVGWRMVNGIAHVFSEIRPALKAHPRRIVNEARRVMAMLPHAVCVADPSIKNAPRFLIWLGWQHIGCTSFGEVYAWRN